MDSLTFPVLLLFLAAGGILLAIEVFLTPGFGVKGTLGLALIVLAVVVAYWRHGPAKGTVVLVGAVVVLTALGWIAKRTLGRRLVLADSIATSASPGAGTPPSVGEEGVAVSLLRPSGIAQVGGHRLDVTCTGEFVEPGTRIRVALVEGNRIVVEKV